MARVLDSVEHIGQVAHRRERSARKYTEEYLVKYQDQGAPGSDLDDIASVACGAAGIPAMYAAHPNHANAYAVAIWAEKTENRYVWLVHVAYETPQGRQYAENPINDEVQFVWGTRTTILAIEWDKDGKAVLNSAYDPFDPPIQEDLYDLTLIIVRNEASYTPATAHTYVNSLNNGNITIAGLAITAREGKLVDFSAEKLERNGYDYYRVVYRIEFNANTWDKQILDQGIYERKPAEDGKRKYCKVEGKDATEPQRLDGSGEQLAETHPAQASVFLTFRIYPETNWSSLSLPTSM